MHMSRILRKIFNNLIRGLEPTFCQPHEQFVTEKIKFIESESTNRVAHTTKPARCIVNRKLSPLNRNMTLDSEVGKKMRDKFLARFRNAERKAKALEWEADKLLRIQSLNSSELFLFFY